MFFCKKSIQDQRPILGGYSSFIFFWVFLCLLFSVSSCSFASSRPPPIPVLPIPSSQQLSWQLSEMALFLHFGPNTFTDTEWGSGHADPSVFNPSALNAAQWVRVAKENGFSRVILTAKHHDGFCLWPSDYTDYSVRSSPWKGGAGDVVAELADAARSADLQLGLYLSPWDRHEPTYGRTLDYNEYYMGQMTELLTRYGAIREVWLDGAKGEGAKDMDYYFDNWFSLVHQLQPQVVIFSDAGPDVRWVGDEAGVSATTCWSSFNTSAAKIGGTDSEYSQGGDVYGHDWVPAECDVSIRPGWFWHQSEAPKSAKALLDIYYKSEGRNCLFLLNVPPNSSGLISEEDIQVLQEFTELRKSIFSHNLLILNNSQITASSTRRSINGSLYGPQNVLQEDVYSYWAPEENQSYWALYVVFENAVSFNVLQVKEPIHMGQRIAEFHLDALSSRGVWQRVTSGTTVGYKRLLQFPLVVSSYQLRLVITKSRADPPMIAYLGIHLDSVSSSTSNIVSSHSNSAALVSTNTSQIGHQSMSNHSFIASS